MNPRDYARLLSLKKKIGGSDLRAKPTPCEAGLGFGGVVEMEVDSLAE